jgi:hypothetical protein
MQNQRKQKKKTKEVVVWKQPESLHPPPCIPQIAQTMRLRFGAIAGVSAQQFTWGNLLTTVLFASSSTNVFALFDQVRLRRVICWAPSASAGATPAQLILGFNGNTAGTRGDGKIHSDMSMSTSPAYLNVAPSRNSQAAQWQSNSNDNAFILTCTAGTVIDVLVDFKNDDSAPAGTSAAVAATAGEIYFRGLDGVAVATTNFPAIAPQTR